MRKTSVIRAAIPGLLAGTVNGLLGAGGGMVLVPLLIALACVDEDRLFPSSVAIMLPICVVSLVVSSLSHPLPFRESLPYLLGSGIGGFASAVWGQKIPTIWLHRAFGILILWGGIRYIW
jgi:uncharacterized membrane protein YfcA